jgi:arylsulfatase A-like enzyme
LTEFGSSKQRFFLGVGFYKPHLPFVATRQDWEAVQTWEHPPALHPEPIDSAHAPSSGEFYGYDMPWPKPRPLAAEHRRQARLAYLACVRYVDRQIGRVLQALEDQDLEDSTIVVLWGDHGWFLGEGAIWGKHTPLELAVRSPLIIRAPGSVLQGASTAALASTLDVYPTLVDLCRPAFTRTRFPLDGESLAPILRGQRDQVRELARSYWNTATSLRSSSHRLIFRERKDKRSAVELYAVSEAASWSQDVAAEHPEIVEALLGAAERLP